MLAGFLILCLSLTLKAEGVGAQEDSDASRRSRLRAAKRQILTRPSYDLRTALSLSQESMKASSGPTKAHMNAQLQGLHVALLNERPLKNLRWVASYGAELGLGALKGEAGGALSDRVGGQPWISLSVFPALHYRSTLHSKIGLIAPLAYRHIAWKLTSPFKVEEEKFSLGLGGIYTHHISRGSAFTISLVHQYQWASTVWAFGWQYQFSK